jgi:glyoxalase superfamily protein
VKVWDQQRALAVIGEAVWWITMVDATLVRHHPGAYDTVLAAHTPAERQRIVEALAGLRNRRARIDQAEAQLATSGATFVTTTTQHGEYCVTMLDPEGNEFDVH